MDTYDQSGADKSAILIQRGKKKRKNGFGKEVEKYEKNPKCWKLKNSVGVKNRKYEKRKRVEG